MSLKTFKEILMNKETINEEGEMGEVLKQDVIDILNIAAETVDSPTESELINLLVSLVKMDVIDPSAYASIFDALNTIIELEVADQEGEFSYEDDVEELSEEELQEVNEATPLYKKAGYVKCPNGMIRKRGQCGKKVDKVRSKLMIKARKKHKMAWRKAAVKALKTKKRTGQM